jgi:hypothetical protein
MRDSRSPETPEMAMAINIDTACREWFHHGRDVYEKRRSQLRQVANEMGIHYLTSRLDFTYAECVEEWREKYLQPDEIPEVSNPVRTMGCVAKVEEFSAVLETILEGDVSTSSDIGLLSDGVEAI